MPSSRAHRAFSIRSAASNRTGSRRRSGARNFLRDLGGSRLFRAPSSPRNDRSPLDHPTRVRCGHRDLMLHALVLANHTILLLSLTGLWMIGLPATWIVLQHLRFRRKALAAETTLLGAPLPPNRELPHVLVQIPSFNEAHLVRRVAAAVAEHEVSFVEARD